MVSLSLMTGSRSFSAPLVEYTIGSDFSPLSWLEYGESASAGNVRRYLLLTVLAVAAALAILAIKLRRVPSFRMKER